MNRRVIIDNRSRLTKSRWPARPLNGRSASMPPYDHPAIMSGHTLYPLTVRPVQQDNRWALKNASNNRKIGGEILTGKWAGLPMYALSLEERATCPKTCKQWRSCYGNKMHLADRVQAGPELESRLEREIEALDIGHLNGFVVRLHVLGDFYSVAYVELWRRLLRQHSTLHIWGYTARHNDDDPIAAALSSVAGEFGWARFAIRLSNAPSEARSTIVVEHPQSKPDDAILCRQEIDKKESCSACALCWESEKRIAFIQH
jgi:hypothetical protein